MEPVDGADAVAKKRQENAGPRYRKVYPLFWDDPAVRRLDDSEKLLALYCITSHQTNRIGIFRFSLATAADDLGIGIGKVSDTFRKRFVKVCDTLKWRFDDQARVLYVPSWWKWNKPENQKHMIGVLRDLTELPQTPLLNEFARNKSGLVQYLRDEFEKYLSDRYTDGMPYQERELIQELEQIRELEREEGSGEQPEFFLVFPTSGTGSREWGLTNEKLNEYVEAFPGVDVPRECRLALQWSRDNASKRKTPQGMPAFLGRWMTKAQNASGNGNGRSLFEAPGIDPSAIDSLKD